MNAIFYLPYLYLIDGFLVLSIKQTCICEYLWVFGDCYVQLDLPYHQI